MVDFCGDLTPTKHFGSPLTTCVLEHCFFPKWPCTRHEHPWLLSIVSTKEENFSGFYKKLMSCRRPFLDLALQECVHFCASPQRLAAAETGTGGSAPSGGDGLMEVMGVEMFLWAESHSSSCCTQPWRDFVLHVMEFGPYRGQRRGGDAFPPSTPWAPVKELSICCSGFANHYNDRLWQ